MDKRTEQLEAYRGLNADDKKIVNEVLRKVSKENQRFELTCPITVQGRTVPCGKCNKCLKGRKNDWMFRLLWEMKAATSALFITLTYDEKNVPWETDGKIKHRTLKREHLIRFHKNVRQFQDRYFKNTLKVEPSDYQIKYYSVGEYGTKTRRPHYHLIMLNIHDGVKDRIDRLWGKGFVKVGDVNGKSIAYTTKYLIDYDTRISNLPIEKPFSIMSKNIGLNYLDKNAKFHYEEGDDPKDWKLYCFNDGFKQTLPRYYKLKIWDENQLEIIGEMQRDRAAEKHFERIQELEEAGQWNYEHNQAIKEHKDLGIKMKSQLKNKL